MKMKKYFLSMFTAVTLFAAFAFVSCSDNDDDDNDDKSSVEILLEQGIMRGILKTPVTLDASKVYQLAGAFIVEEGGELSIPAGTVIKSGEGFGNYILIATGAKIYVNGTADKPVVMTTDSSNPKQGYWGGLIINGKAPLTKAGEVGSTEINTSYKYGGDLSNDNSGVITYLKLEYTGARSSANVEHNGLTLNGVGSGTKIENLYIPNGADDAIEFFGGSVDVKNLLVVNSDDDMFDFTQGYNGTLENAYGIWETGYQSSEEDPRGIEADGNLDGKFPENPNQSNFIVKNVTFDLRLAPSTEEGFYMHDVIKLRRGANATITNALVKGVGQAKDLIDLTDGKGNGNPAAKISLTSTLTTAISGKSIATPEGVSYPNVKVEAGNTGCPTNIFAWTGYTAF